MAFSLWIGCKELAPYYSHTGRPSIDPVLMIRMLIVGYVFAIRSERRLCSEVQVNLAYRWFCKLGIEDGIPDHSVFSRARHERFRQSDALRRVFEGVMAKCIAAGLVGGEGFSIDASLIRADAGKKKRVPGDEPIAWPRAEEASRSVREYLAALDAADNDEEIGGDDCWGAAATGRRIHGRSRRFRRDLASDSGELAPALCFEPHGLALCELRHARFPLSISLWRNAFNSRAGNFELLGPAAKIFQFVIRAAREVSGFAPLCNGFIHETLRNCSQQWRFRRNESRFSMFAVRT
jgi:transposase